MMMQEEDIMLQMFNDCKDTGKIMDALLIGRNMVNRDPGNHETFHAYFDYLCTLAENLPALEDRQRFAEQASVSLAFYSENANLTEDLIVQINEYQQRVDTVFEENIVKFQQRAAVETEELQSRNSECLKKIYSLKDALSRTASQKEFDAVLGEIGQVDGEIDKDNLTKEHNRTYETLTKELTDLISAKMRELEYKRNVAYNKQAADAFAKAFKQFKENESKFKNQTQLFALVSKTLFAFDASRLFNETLIYYNHVYSYLFSKLDEDGKLALTRFSIECERRLK